MIDLVKVGDFFHDNSSRSGHFLRDNSSRSCFFFKLALSIRMFNRAVILDISKCIQPTSIHEVFNQINSAPV